MKKRICLLAAYDSQNIIDDYVVYLVKELSKFSDVYYYSDNNMADSEFKKLDGIAKSAKGHSHGCYDFGSWSFIMQDIGHEKLSEYDEVILTNEAAFGPMVSLNHMLNDMDSRNVDVWGMCGNKFIMSFFIALSKKVFTHPDFKHFFNNIKAEGDKNVVIKKYEQGINRLITDNKFSTSVYISGQDTKTFYNQSKKDIKCQIKTVTPFWARPFVKVQPGKVRLYDDSFLIPLMMKMPVLKKVSLLLHDSILGAHYVSLIKENTDYPVELITNYFKRINKFPPSTKVAIKSRIRTFLRSFIFRRKYKRNKIIFYIFKIPVWFKTMNYKI